MKVFLQVVETICLCVVLCWIGATFIYIARGDDITVIDGTIVTVFVSFYTLIKLIRIFWENDL